MKKILIISQNSLSLHANNGKTLTGVFDKWGSDDLAQIYFQDEIPESNKYNNFYRIRDIDIVKSFGFNRCTVGGVVRPRATIDDHHIEKSEVHKRLIGYIKRFSMLKNIVREFLYKSNRWYSTDLEGWLKKFSPDAIFLVPSIYSFTYDVAYELKNKLDIPIYIYYTDDFLGDDLVNISSSYKTKALDMMNLSSGRFVIGEEMARVYRERYCQNFNVLINPVVVSKGAVLVGDIISKNVINIVYAGGLTLGRFDALISFSRLLASIVIEVGKKVLIKVCSGDVPTQDQKEDFVRHNIDFLGRLNSVEVQELFADADFVLHVESHLEEHVKMTRLSVSTKIPECLSSGVGLIAYGPSEIASMRLIYENAIGFYIDSRADCVVSSKKLVSALTDQLKYQVAIEKGINYAEVNFSSEAIYSNLIRIIN